MGGKETKEQQYQQLIKLKGVALEIPAAALGMTEDEMERSLELYEAFGSMGWLTAPDFLFEEK
jgi:hypothetical protein